VLKFNRPVISVASNNFFILHCVIIIAITAVSYLNCWHADFISLDDMSILDSLQTSERTLSSMFLGGGGDYFRPLTFISFIFDLSLFGRDARWFHFVNLLIHIANSLLLYLLARQLFKQYTQGGSAAFCAALLFALHPVNTEAVMWVASRTDLLCCFFFLLALIAGLNMELSNAKAGGAFFLMYLCSLLAKEASIAVVLIVPFYCLLNRKTISKSRCITLLTATGTATLLYLLMRNGFTSTPDKGIVKVISASSSSTQFLTETLAVFGFYVKKLFVPLPLNFAIVTVNTHVYVWVGIVFVLIVTIMLFRASPLRLPLLIVVCGIVPPLMAMHGKLPWTPFAERYLYIPSIGFALVAGTIIACFDTVWLRRLFYGVVMVCGVITVDRVALWTDSKAFWYDVLNKSPEFSRSYVGVAIELIKESKLDEAQVLLKKSLKMGFNSDFVWSNLAAIHLARKNYTEYEKAIDRAAQLSKQPASYYRMLVQVVTRHLDYYDDKDALYRRIAGYYLKAYAKDPTYIDGLYNTAKTYMYLNENELALKYFNQFLETPGDTMYRPYAKLLIAKIEKK